MAVLLAVAAWGAGAQGQTPASPANPLATPGRPGANRTPAQPSDTAQYRSTIVELGGGARVGLLYEPKAPVNPRVAILYSDRNFGFEAPAIELANRGYRVLYVSYPPLGTGEIGLPFDGFLEASQGIRYLRTLAGVQRVVVEGWGAGAGSMTLYASVAAKGPAACQGRTVIFPCTTEQASGLARPDGLILLDPGGVPKAFSIDPAYDGNTRKAALDRLSTANGYDRAAGRGAYAAAFRKRYFAAQSERNNRIIDDALARWKARNEADEPLVVPAGVNVAASASLHDSDPGLISRTRHPHLVLGVDGRTTATVRSIRPLRSPAGEAAIAAAALRSGQPASPRYTLREFLANDATRTTGDLALTDSDIRGVDWTSSLSAPGQAANVSVPTLVMSMTCFQFVVPAEIVLDRLAAKDKTLVGVEGAEHEFGPCAPRYGDTSTRLFDYVGEWLGKPGRF